MRDIMGAYDENEVKKGRYRGHENGPRPRQRQGRVDGDDGEGDDAHEAKNRCVVFE